MIEGFFRGLASDPWLHLLWIVLLFTSFLGWGALLVAVLRLRRLSAGFWPVLGCAAVLLVGGWLNLFRAVSRESVFWVAACGWGVLLFRWIYHWTRAWRTQQFMPKPPQAWGHWGLMAFSLPLIYGTLSEGAFRLGAPWPPLIPDLAAAAALPLKMAEAGGLGNDPFSETRLTGGFGSLYFLQAMASLPLGEKALAPVDGSLGHWMLLATVFGWGRLRGLGGWRLAAVLLVVLGLRLNANPLGGGHVVASLLLCLHAVFDHQAHRAFAETRSLASAILGAAILSLHPGCAVPTAFLFAFHLLSGLLRHRPLWKPPVEYLLTTLTLAAGLLPWMLSLQTSSETLYFPFLGDGNHAGVPPPSWDAVLWAELPSGLLATRESLLVLLAAGTMVAWAWRTRLSRDWEAGSLVLAVPCGIAMAYLFWPTLRPALGEIYASFLWAALLHAVIRLWAWASDPKGSAAQAALSAAEPAPAAGPPLPTVRLAGGMAIFLLGSMAALAWQPSEIRRQFRFLADPLRAWEIWQAESPMRLADSSATRLHRALQDSVPEFAAVLDLTGQPHLYDLARNRIFLCERPGRAGPRPGWPDSADAESLFRYLRKGGVRYVAYSDFALALSDTATREGRLLRAVDSLQLVLPVRFEAEGYRLIDLSDSRRRKARPGS